jgi:hypothetical protein
MATYVSPSDVLASVLAPAIERPALSRELTIQASPLGIRRSPVIAPADLQDVKGHVAHHKGHRYGVAIIAIVVVGVACAAVSLTVGRSATIPATHDKPLDGLTIFAVFFVAALTIERLLEPLSNAMLPKAYKQRQAEDAKTDAGQEILQLHAARNDYSRLVALCNEFQAGEIDAERARQELSDLSAYNAKEVLEAATKALDQAKANGPAVDAAAKAALQRVVHAAVKPPAKEATAKIETAAESAEALSVRELLRTTTFWVIATCLGMIIAAMMKLYFLNTVGITAGSAWLEILATGLIIGAGTKPLHDLVQMMSTKSAAGEALGA